MPEKFNVPNIQPISNLKNYMNVLKDVTDESPVYLTKCGRGEYIILTMQAYKKFQTKLCFLAELVAADPLLQQEKQQFENKICGKEE